MLDLVSHKTPLFAQKLFPSFCWRRETSKKEIFLTFDDGPIPDLTPNILALLAAHNVKASFFCVGENIKKHPDVFESIIKARHTVGNHTYNHLKSWQSKGQNYLDNIRDCQLLIDNVHEHGKKYFRPPYGQIRPLLFKKIQEQGFQIIMWDVLSKDYKQNLNQEVALQSCIAATMPGSIIVFHDNLKAQNNVLTLLPMYINHFKSLGFKFMSL